MDIDRIRYFCVVASSGSLVKASEILNISQPALSKSLRVLESEVHLSLFERNGRKLELTEQGNKFRVLVEPMLNDWLGLSSKIETSKRSDRVRVGSFEVFTTYFLGHLLRSASVSEFELYELVPGHLEDAITSGRIDVGITYHPISKPKVRFTEATQIQMGVFGLRKFEGVPFEKLPFVVPNDLVQGTPTKVMGLDGWLDHEFPRNITCKVTLMESALELCRQGVTVGYFPVGIIKLHNLQIKKEYELIPLECPLKKRNRIQSVFLVQHQDRQETKFVRSFAKALRTFSSL